jgi:hypothetical protein
MFQDRFLLSQPNHASRALSHLLCAIAMHFKELISERCFSFTAIRLIPVEYPEAYADS